MQAFYHFFRDDIVVCWRLCGIAGRTAMELGLHTSDAVQCATNLGGQAEDVANIVASVIVLDRQWSAATGLPTHFSNSTFDKKLVQKVIHSPLSPLHERSRLMVTGHESVSESYACVLHNE